MHFRPGDLPQGDPSNDDTPVEWSDNWLSNTLAWFSHKFLPRWCQTENHWTSRVTQYLFTDCPCCMLFRGFTVGGIVGLLAGLMLASAVWVPLMAAW